MKCQEYHEWVVINKDTETYDLIFDEHKNRSPIYHEYVKVKSVDLAKVCMAIQDLYL